MGNRACIAFGDEATAAVYVHWNGGPETVYAVLDYMATNGYRMAEDDSYALARCAEIFGRFFGGTTSVGIVTSAADTLDARCADLADVGDDHGTYLVCKPLYGKGRYSVRRWDRRGHEMTRDEVVAEATAAREHAYWTADEPILTAIARKMALAPEPKATAP